MIKTQAVTILGSGVLVVVLSSALSAGDGAPYIGKCAGRHNRRLPGFEDCRAAPERLP
jgi:hypothetical protein